MDRILNGSKHYRCGKDFVRVRISLVILVCTACFVHGLDAINEYDEIIKAPYTDVLTTGSPEQEKQITTEMLGAVMSADTVYRDDSTLLHTLREFQALNKIPPYDYKFCLAGPMTLELLIKQYMNSAAHAGSYYRELYMRSDPAKKSGAVNLRGNDVVEFQIMYNTWASENGNPLLIAGSAKSQYSNQLEVDGYFGKFSSTAAVIFQKSETLLAKKDGVVDAKTWKLLYVRTYLSRNVIVKQLLQWSNANLP